LTGRYSAVSKGAPVPLFRDRTSAARLNASV
jgi:hypothetical protein